MKSLVQYIYENKDDNYSEYLKKRAEIADKYDHENGPEINKKMDELEQKEYDALDKKYTPCPICKPPIHYDVWYLQLLN